MVSKNVKFSLRHESDFFRTAKRIESEGVRWFARASKDDLAQLTVVVPKASQKLATGRNKLKRQLRGLFSLEKHLYPPAHIVAVVKKHGQTPLSLANSLSTLRHSLRESVSKGENR